MRAVSWAAFVLAIMAANSTEAAEDRSGLPLPVRPCAVCHGNHGISELSGIPNLAGQKVDYLVEQITKMQMSAQVLLGLGGGLAERPPSAHEALWTDHRENRIMARQTTMLSQEDIREVAEHFAAKPRACPPPGTERGARSALVERCAVCHGEDGISTTPYVPNLAGQHRLYLADQIQKMRSANRGEVFIDADIARSTGIMGTQALLVPENQIAMLAHWFANIPCADKK